jgi:Phage tail tube protein
MSSYISSNANRFYTALESEYGQVAEITAVSRIPALKLAVRQQLEVTQRKDKTGSRTFPGVPPGGRLRTDFDLRTYMTSWAVGEGQPSHGPLFQAALGGAPMGFGGGTVASGTAGGRLTLAADHGLSAGQAVTCGGELRFVNAVVDARTVQLNAPFTSAPEPGAAVGATVTYTPATELPSVSVYDYWSPETAVQRLLRGAAVDQLKILVNGDFHEFQFSGIAQDVLDTSSFSGEAGVLASFPEEPALAGFDYSVVPGNMGQAWLGTMASQFFTITSAQIAVKNELDARGREFGSRVPRAVAPGRRSVTADLELYGLDDEATKGLYQAARQQSPMAVMFQLGEAAGQTVGVMLRSVVPVVPEFDDSENRLRWRFRGSRAQGTVDDEVSVAFG